MNFCKPSFPLKKTNSFISNDLYELAHAFSQSIFGPDSAPLSRKIVITPSNVIKEFLTQYLIARHKIVFGLRFLTLAQAFDLFAKLSYVKRPTFPSHLPFMFYLEGLIDEMLGSNDPILAPLKDYVMKSEMSKTHLATELSHVFLHYTIYGDKALAEWEKESGWQQILWKRVQEDWDLPHLVLQNGSLTPEIPLECHLFDIAHIPKLFQTALERFAKKWPISYYFLSPSPLFWSDFLSTKEQAKLDKLFQQQGIRLGERKDFRSIMRENHKLISNWGKLGKQLFETLSSHQCTESFAEPEGSSMLALLKKDLFFMERAEAFPKDGSIVIHKAQSKLHEVELLYKHLTEIFAENALFPSDVAVALPGSEDYYPHIQYVFGAEDSPFGFHISDLSITSQNPYMKNLKLLFDVLEGRFQPDLLYELFSSPYFAKKHEITKEELFLLESLVKQYHIRWGYNKAMRREILEKDQISDVGSWKYAFAKLTRSLPYLDCPYSISCYEALGEIMRLIDELYQAREDLLSKKRSIDGWIKTLEALTERFLASSEEASGFFKDLMRLHILNKKTSSYFTYCSIQRALKEIFAKSGESVHKPGDRTISFFSLSEAGLPAAEFLFILGADEESFPRQNTYRSLNRLKKRIGSDHQPTAGEKDRYAFLKALLLAKKALIFSYVGFSESDGKELHPSMLLSELMDYVKLDLVQTHPPFLFNTSYFAKKNYLKEPYEIAKYRQDPPPKEPAHISAANESTEKHVDVSLRDLQKLMKNPLSVYCNKTLGVYLDLTGEKQKREASEFFLSYLDRAAVKSDLLKGKMAEKERLPTALFHDAAKIEIENQAKKLKAGLAHFGISREAIHTLSFPKTKNSEGPNPIEFSLPGGPHGSLFGTIDRVCEKGLVLPTKCKNTEIWKLLPDLVALAHTDYPTTLLFLESREEKTFSKEQCRSLLEPLLEYYFKALKSPSPLLPDWVEVHQKNPALSFADIMKKKPPPFEDPYLSFSPPGTDETWKQITESLCNLLTV